MMSLENYFELVSRIKRRSPIWMAINHLFYNIKIVLVFFFRLNQQIHDDGDVAHSVVTPVRRSTRLSKRSLPSILQEHDTLVESLTELPSSTQKNLLFTPNSHLRHNVNEVSKKLDDDIMEKV